MYNIRSQVAPVDEPVFDIDDGTLAQIVCATGHKGQSAAGPDDTKRLLNLLFSEALKTLHNLLRTKDPASWILEAYKQVLMWTMVYRSNLIKDASYVAPREFAPVGRYGWRYVIDHLIPTVSEQQLYLDFPTFHDLSKVWTALIVMQNASEWSNLLHHFPDVYADVSINLSNQLESLIPKLSDQNHEILVGRAKYLQRKNDQSQRRYPGLDPGLSDQRIRNILSNGLKGALGFTLEEMESVTEALINNVLSSGYIMVQPQSYIVEGVANACSISQKRIIRVLDFMLLSHDRPASHPRDFLDKNEPIRMLHFAGVKLPRLMNLESIYAESAAQRSDIQRANNHIIMNVLTLADWKDAIEHQLCNGQRSDLKSIKHLGNALESIEQYQRKHLFEAIVATILQEHGFITLTGLKKWPNPSGRLIALTCGEIDVIAYNPTIKLLIITECKANAPATDARGFSQQKKDHFEQKDYHGKFLRKIAWMNDPDTNLQELQRFEEKMQIAERPRILPLFVTKYPSVARFYTQEYRVVTIEELHEELERIVQQAL